METIKSIGASHGFGYGTLSIYSKEIDFSKKGINNYPESIEKLVNEYKSKAETLANEGRNVESEILGSYILLLTDPEINSTLDSNSTIEGVFKVYEDNARQLELLDDEYFSQRAEDIRSVCKEVIINMQGYVSSFNLDKGTILAAQDLTPTDTSNMNLKNVQGLIIQHGGTTSHAVIVAKNLGIPCVIGLNEEYLKLEDGQEVLLNGESGEIVISPSPEKIKEINIKIEEQRELVESFTSKKLSVSDIELRVNIGSIEEIEDFDSDVLDSIGLFRSEFIYFNSKEAPSLKQKIDINNQISKKFSGTVVYRLLDIGGDKQIQYLNLNKEENPFLGVRGIRLLESNKNLFRSQIESIFRSELYGKTKVMLPMVSTVQDVTEARDFIFEIAEKEEKKPMPIGVMIETPSAALISDKLAKIVDFFSIGTNDLVQYTMAADRGNVELSHYQDTLNPAVLKLIKNVISVGKENNIEVSVCGEMASDQVSALVLYSLGLRVFSISPSSAPLIFHTLTKSDFIKNKVTINVDDFSTTEELRKYMSEHT